MALMASLRFVKIVRRRWIRGFRRTPVAEGSGASCKQARGVARSAVLHSTHTTFNMSGTRRRKRKSLRPIFSVRSWTSNELCRFLKPSCSRSTALEGVAVYRYAALPLVSACHVASHVSCECLRWRDLVATLQENTSSGVGAFGPVEPFFSNRWLPLRLCPLPHCRGGLGVTGSIALRLRGHGGGVSQCSV